MGARKGPLPPPPPSPKRVPSQRPPARPPPPTLSLTVPLPLPLPLTLALALPLPLPLPLALTLTLTRCASRSGSTEARPSGRRQSGARRGRGFGWRSGGGCASGRLAACATLAGCGLSPETFLAFSSPGRRGSEPRCVSTSHARPRSHRWRPDGRRRAARSAWKRTGSTLTSRGALVCAARAHRRLSIAQGVHPDLLIVLPFSAGGRWPAVVPPGARAGPGSQLAPGGRVCRRPARVDDWWRCGSGVR